VFVVKEFPTEKGAAKFARGFNWSRKHFDLPPLEVRHNSIGSWEVVDTARGPDGKWPQAEVTAREAQLGVQTLVTEDEYMR